MGSDGRGTPCLPHTHRCVSALEGDPGGEALVLTLVAVDIDDAQGPVLCSLRTNLHHAQVPALLFGHQARPHCAAWKSGVVVQGRGMGGKAGGTWFQRSQLTMAPGNIVREGTAHAQVESSPLPIGRGVHSGPRLPDLAQATQVVLVPRGV